MPENSKIPLVGRGGGRRNWGKKKKAYSPESQRSLKALCYRQKREKDAGGKHCTAMSRETIPPRRWKSEVKYPEAGGQSTHRGQKGDVFIYSNSRSPGEGGGAL